jgi:hypothetical protein
MTDGVLAPLGRAEQLLVFERAEGLRKVGNAGKIAAGLPWNRTSLRGPEQSVHSSS